MKSFIKFVLYNLIIIFTTFLVAAIFQLLGTTSIFVSVLTIFFVPSIFLIISHVQKDIFLRWCAITSFILLILFLMIPVPN